MGSSSVYIHAFTDGRDTSPTGAQEYMAELLARAKEIGGERPAKVATISGRYYAMDRDNRWDRIARVYWAMTRAEGQRATDPVAAIAASYERKVTDEFIEPIVLVEDDRPVAIVEAGDAVIYFNFRSDRGRELTKAFALPEMPPQAAGKFDRGPRLDDLVFVTMTEYESGLPVEVAFPADNVTQPLAKILSDRGLTQFHTAETEKYAHVTFFFNGGREAPFPGEDRLLVPSPKVATYDLKPEMSAPELTDEAVRRIQSGDYDVIIMNYANADMVGHTGVLEAAVKAVEAVDAGVGRGRRGDARGGRRGADYRRPRQRRAADRIRYRQAADLAHHQPRPALLRRPAVAQRAPARGWHPGGCRADHAPAPAYPAAR